MENEETVEDILRKHDLEEAIFILRRQLDKEEKEREALGFTTSCEPSKQPRPSSKRKASKWIGAKIGRNQKIILHLLNKYAKTTNQLKREFTDILYQLPTRDEEERAEMLFWQALRQLENRGLVKTRCPPVERGRREKIVEITETAKDFIFYRKPTDLENFVVRVLNQKIIDRKKTVTNEEIIHELAKMGIGGPHVNSTSVGRILNKYAFRMRTRKGALYHLFGVRIPPAR
jgi:DNA-binding PadR family transcriptional regulator